MADNKRDNSFTDIVTSLPLPSAGFIVFSYGLAKLDGLLAPEYFSSLSTSVFFFHSSLLKLPLSLLRSFGGVCQPCLADSIGGRFAFLACFAISAHSESELV